MDALEALHTRVSAPRLGGDPPDENVLNNIFEAALRAPDHALLRPWRFIVVKQDGLSALGDLFADVTREMNPDATEAEVEKARGKPLRAPMIVVVVANVTEHAKVPDIEQVISAGAAAQCMLLAAHAQGIGAMWRTGGMAYHPSIHARLGLSGHEQIIGFLYMGEREGKPRNLPGLSVEDYVSHWEGSGNTSA